MRTAIIIPVKENSQRCPGKNLRPFADSSLMERAIRTALSTGKDTFVISASETARQRAKQAGATPIPRPPELEAEGVELVPDVMRWVIEAIPGYTHYLLLQVTNPFVSGEHLLQALCHDSAFTVEQAGGLYLGPKEMWEKGLAKLDTSFMIYVEPSVDIDTVGDFEKAEKWLLS